MVFESQIPNFTLRRRMFLINTTTFFSSIEKYMEFEYWFWVESGVNFITGWGHIERNVPAYSGFGKKHWLGNILYCAKSSPHSVSSFKLVRGTFFYTRSDCQQASKWSVNFSDSIFSCSCLRNVQQKRQIFLLKISKGHCQLRHLVILKYDAFWCEALATSFDYFYFC